MRDNFDPVLLREHLAAWNNAEAARWRLKATIEKGMVGQSVSNPVPLPVEVAGKSATARCDWALAQLAIERKNLADCRLKEDQAAKLRSQLVQLKAQKLAAQRASARKTLVRLTLVSVVCVVIAAIALAVWWVRRPPSISKSAVESSVAGELVKHGLSLSSLSFQVGPRQGGMAVVASKFTAKLDQPLYVSVPVQPFLQNEWKLDLGTNRRIAELVLSKDSRRLLELAGLADRPPDLTKISLVKVATRAGSSYNGTANLLAAERNSGWGLSMRSIAVPGFPQNQLARGQFPGAVFDTGSDDDRAKFRALADQQPQILARLERARDTHLAEVMAQHQKEELSLIAVLRPGALFTGTVPVRNEKKSAYLEITEATGGSGVHPLKAVFHNDGGWGDGRLFEGDWKFDLTAQQFKMSLVSRSDEVIRGGGPVLDDPRLLNLDLVITGERMSGQLAGSPSEWTHVADSDTDRIKRAASPDYFAMLDALSAEVIYAGTVNVSANDTQTVLLHFTGPANDKGTVEATLEDPNHAAWQFRLAGIVIGNRYREANWPLRLAQVRDSEPPGISPAALVLQFRAMALRMESGLLMADFRGRTFRFESLPPDETARRRQLAANRRRALEATLRAGAVFDGTATDPAKTQHSALRLRVVAFDDTKNTLEARLESASSPTLYRMLEGKVYHDAGVLRFPFDMRPNTYGIARTAVEPWFKGGGDTLILSVDEASLNGQDGYTWSFEFRVP